MNDRKLNDSDLAEDIYLPNNIPVGKIVLFGLMAMFLGFALNFPMGSIIEAKVRSTLTENPTCPIQSQSFHFRAFPPLLQMQGVQIPGSCFQNPNQSLQFDTINFQLARPSFYPVGALFKTELMSSSDQINVDLSIGIPSPKFRLYPSKISTNSLNALAGTDGLLRGDFQLEGQGNLDWGFDLSSMSMIIQSQNLSIPNQTIQGLQLPRLNFGNALIKLRLYDQTDLRVEELIIGSDASPMTASIIGAIELNQRFLGTSEISLQTELFMAEDLINSFPIVNLFLGNYAKGDGHFEFLLTGPLGSPRFSRP